MDLTNTRQIVTITVEITAVVAVGGIVIFFLFPNDGLIDCRCLLCGTVLQRASLGTRGFFKKRHACCRLRESLR